MIAREDREAFAERVAWAREAAGYTQEETALLLDISQARYSKYEGSRATLMPHALIPKFCLITRVSIEWLMTGQGKAPPRPSRRRALA